MWRTWLFSADDGPSWCHHSCQSCHPPPLRFHQWVTIPWLLPCCHHTIVNITEVFAPTLMLILTTEECCHNVGAQDTLRAPSPDLLRVLIPESRLQLDINGDINAEGGASSHVTNAVCCNSSNSCTGLFIYVQYPDYWVLQQSYDNLAQWKLYANKFVFSV